MITEVIHIAIARIVQVRAKATPDANIVKHVVLIMFEMSPKLVLSSENDSRRANVAPHVPTP